MCLGSDASDGRGTIIFATVHRSYDSECRECQNRSSSEATMEDSVCIYVHMYGEGVGIENEQRSGSR